VIATIIPTQGKEFTLTNNKNKIEIATKMIQETLFWFSFSLKKNVPIERLILA